MGWSCFRLYYIKITFYSTLIVFFIIAVFIFSFNIHQIWAKHWNYMTGWKNWIVENRFWNLIFSLGQFLIFLISLCTYFTLLLHLSLDTHSILPLLLVHLERLNRAQLIIINYVGLLRHLLHLHWVIILLLDFYQHHWCCFHVDYFTMDWLLELGLLGYETCSLLYFLQLGLRHFCCGFTGRETLNQISARCWQWGLQFLLTL